MSEQLSTLRDELNERNRQIEELSKYASRLERERDVSLKFNTDLRNQLELVNAKLHLHQNVMKTITANAGTQTHISLMADSNSWRDSSQTSNTRIADLVRETAEEVLKNSAHNNDYYYDPKSNTYYSRSTGWYYYPERSLFYDPNTKNYYNYDSETKKYVFYSSLHQTSKQTKNKRKNSEKNVESKTLKKESNEITVENSPNDSDSETIDISSSEEGEVESSDDDPKCGQSDCGPPLVRLIVKESSTLQNGSLLLVTCMGANIGNDSKCDVWITDESVSKLHAQIKYNDGLKNYWIRDLNSTNGTFRNGIKMDHNNECELNHNDEICFGECRLLVHIHNGRDVTCINCEPGLVQHNLKLQQQTNHLYINFDKEKDRRKNLKTLKKKFGLSKIDYCQLNFITSDHYKDRSDERRKIKGSDNPYEKTSVGTSLNTSLPKTNKGFQLLEKMGWKCGEGLGKKQNVNIDLIPIEVRQTRAGLGNQTNISSVTNNTELELEMKKKNEKWKKAMNRFESL